MTIKDLLVKVENGTQVIIWDGNSEEVVFNERVGFDRTWQEYGNYEVCAINTSCNDCDMEIVIAR